MHPHAELITRFYTAFKARDPAGMAACYHPEVHFTDPAFPDLHGAEAAAMWRMLVTRGKDLQLEFSDVSASDSEGRAHWDATYTFSKTGRRVLNRIDASFQFRDGLIVRHIDCFSFPRWARQALGLPGLLFGQMQWFQKKVQTQAAMDLAQFQKS